MIFRNGGNGACHYDVIVIGGGATGAGTARDCAMLRPADFACRTFRFYGRRDRAAIMACCIAGPDMR